MPVIVLDVRPSLRVKAVALIVGCAILIAVMLAPGTALAWRVCVAGLVGLLAWPPVRTIIFGRGPEAIRRIEWQSDGRWRLTEGSGRVLSARLAGGSVTLGGWLLLVWKGSRQCRYALIDSACTAAPAFRALKGRLS